jgi:uncharacterized protein YdbL (DUF1318 family)
MNRAFVTVLAALAGCKAPSVNLATPEPIKVDIAMRLDVYQHGGNRTAQSPRSEQKTDPAQRRRNRMADIQDFKNQRLVGENREGLVTVLAPPQGEYGDYVRQTVDAENADRLEQMKDLAEARKTSLPDVQKEQAALWRNRAFAGELVEVETQPGTWEWKPKGSS